MDTLDNILAKSEGQNIPNLAPTRAKFVLSRPFLCKDLEESERAWPCELETRNSREINVTAQPIGNQL